MVQDIIPDLKGIFQIHLMEHTVLCRNYEIAYNANLLSLLCMLNKFGLPSN